MADCRTSYDIQKHGVTICSELDPSNIFGMDRTLCYFSPILKRSQGWGVCSVDRALASKAEGLQFRSTGPMSKLGRHGSLPVIPAFNEQKDRGQAGLRASWRHTVAKSASTSSARASASTNGVEHRYTREYTQHVIHTTCQKSNQCYLIKKSRIRCHYESLSAVHMRGAELMWSPHMSLAGTSVMEATERGSFE